VRLRRISATPDFGRVSGRAPQALRVSVEYLQPTKPRACVAHSNAFATMCDPQLTLAIKLLRLVWIVELLSMVAMAVCPINSSDAKATPTFACWTN
jgi:hypothetical protein